jgi:hypothetical protein
MLRDKMLKILLQQYLPKAVIPLAVRIGGSALQRWSTPHTLA